MSQIVSKIAQVSRSFSSYSRHNFDKAKKLSDFVGIFLRILALGALIAALHKSDRVSIAERFLLYPLIGGCSILAVSMLWLSQWISHDLIREQFPADLSDGLEVVVFLLATTLSLLTVFGFRLVYSAVLDSALSL